MGTAWGLENPRRLRRYEEDTNREELVLEMEIQSRTNLWSCKPVKCWITTLEWCFKYYIIVDLNNERMKREEKKENSNEKNINKVWNIKTTRYKCTGTVCLSDRLVTFQLRIERNELKKIIFFPFLQGKNRTRHSFACSSAVHIVKPVFILVKKKK